MAKRHWNKRISDINKMIDKERKIWQKGYPEARTLLKKFANKIKLEIDLISD